MTFCLLILGTAAHADPSIRMNVSAVVPPEPCEFPQTCETAQANVPTKAIVDEESIRYIGSRPSVDRKDDVLTVLF